MVQEVLVLQEQTSGEKKLNCTLSTWSSKRKKFKILSARSRKKPQEVTSPTANREYPWEVYCIRLNQQYTDLKPIVNSKRERQNVILILFRTMQTICPHCKNGLKAEGKSSIFAVLSSCKHGSKYLCFVRSCSVFGMYVCCMYVAHLCRELSV